MPGYVMHLAEAGVILAELRAQQAISKDWEQRFLTGTLLPDTRLKDEKNISHFWNPKELAELALAPDLGLFLEAYKYQLTDPIVLGYLAHLHLDTAYVHGYWPTVIAFYGADGQVETVKTKISEVEILHTGQRVPVAQFFSPEYYYGDYSKMNRYLIEKYGLAVPEWRQLAGSPVKEVTLTDMQRIEKELTFLLSRGHAGDEKYIRIFDLHCFEQFMVDTAHRFCSLYGMYAAAATIE